MINLIIKNFKCFRATSIPVNQLTVLTGANGNGKSTAIQSLLLLRRTIEHCGSWEDTRYTYNKINGLSVELNGVYCLNLGNSENILPTDYDEPKIILGISVNEGNFQIDFSTNTGQELGITPENIINELKDNPLFYQEFYYLNAERIGPRITQTIKFYDYPNVGAKGENTAQIISDIDSNYHYRVDEKRQLKDPTYLKGSRFQHQINAWLSYIIDGATIIPYRDDHTHTSRIVVESKFSKGKSTFPTNTGFGISYVLPIIVSALIAEEDRFLIVENPEAHLHPSAQSRMGYFLAVIANAGVKIIIETHSDHIINGIQLAVARKNIDFEKCTINFFCQGDQDRQPEVKTIPINEKGELQSWPKGFFDQSQIDLTELFKMRRE
ncbi:AAA family ATPase [Taibaiella helva]|uniref:AAA family ATPase n=1 Tax=Taibaiella helva TaxID=2301235 RepID=UPI000E56EE7C|nr:DUF3696 domain-containing protein [Taibaiella helva]